MSFTVCLIRTFRQTVMNYTRLYPGYENGIYYFCSEPKQRAHSSLLAAGSYNFASSR